MVINKSNCIVVFIIRNLCPCTPSLTGCNGARIRYAPQSEWASNAALSQALALLQPAKDAYGDGLSWADLIVLAGSAALEEASAGLAIPFRGGRVDALSNEDPYPDYLENRLSGGGQGDDIDSMKDVMLVWGLSPQEFVALVGGGHSLGRMHQDRSGFPNGTWTTNPDVLDNQFFANLKNLDWIEQWGETNLIHYNATNGDGVSLQMLRTDMNMIFDAEFRAIVEDYISNEALFLTEFKSAWEKIMTADLYGYTATEATTSSDDGDDDDNELSTSAVIGISVSAGAIGGGVLVGAVGYFSGIFASAADPPLL
jgi:catalase (peroxidase I)